MAYQTHCSKLCPWHNESLSVDSCEKTALVLQMLRPLAESDGDDFMVSTTSDSVGESIFASLMSGSDRGGELQDGEARTRCTWRRTVTVMSLNGALLSSRTASHEYCLSHASSKLSCKVWVETGLPTLSVRPDNAGGAVRCSSTMYMYMYRWTVLCYFRSQARAISFTTAFWNAKTKCRPTCIYNKKSAENNWYSSCVWLAEAWSCFCYRHVHQKISIFASWSRRACVKPCCRFCFMPLLQCEYCRAKLMSIKLLKNMNLNKKCSDGDIYVKPQNSKALVKFLRNLFAVLETWFKEEFWSQF